MSRKLRRVCCACLAVLACAIVPALLPSESFGQNRKEDTSRRLIHQVDPEYPWDLKRAHIGGVVRLMVVVTPRGTIDSISTIGGNPVLVDTALRAVKKWKYAPADSQTTIQVNIDFDPNH